ncbi:MAG TPA: hypothetical protein VGJ57_01665 [Nitrospirales bacterium]|jgi:hypothetical protein
MKITKPWSVAFILILGVLLPTVTSALDPTVDPDIVQLKQILERSQQIMDSPTPPSPQGMLERSFQVLGLSDQAEKIMNTTHRRSDFGMSLRHTLEKYSVELMFVVADLFRDTQEITKAKDIYTEIIKIYSGSAWSSYRDRATMELAVLRNKLPQESPSTDRFSIRLPFASGVGPKLRSHLGVMLL